MKFGTPCSEVPFEELRVGDYVTSAIQNPGVIINKTESCDMSAGDTGRRMLMIRWDTGKLSYVYHYMADKITMR